MRKFTLFMMSLFLMLGTAMAQNYSLTETGISSEELNAKTAPTLIAIKNLSATNNYYFVGNTGAVPYSAAEFSDAAVFVWQPVEEGVAGSYYLMKLDGTYMQATSPKDFGTVDGAAVFTTTNPTTAGTGSTYFNGDGDSQAFIVDEALLVRFVNAAGTWINVQNGDNGTPTYNSGPGGWTIHHIYAVEEAAVEPEPEAPFEVVAVTPAEAVTELSTITVEFSEEIAGEQDIMDTMNYIYVGSRSNACNFTVEGKVLTITLWTPITTPGEYALKVPAGVGITRVSNGEAVVIDGEITFTVEAPAAPFEVVAVTPAEAVTELSTITVEFSEEIASEQDIMDTMNYIYVGSARNACNFTVEGKVLTITLWTPITAAGEYALYIPEGVGITRASNGEAVVINGEITFTVEEPVVEPEPGNMVKIYHITVEDTARGALYATAENTHLTHCGATYGNYHNRDIAVNAEDINQQFVFVEYEGTQFLYSLGAQKFAVKYGQYIKLTENPEGFVTVEDADVAGYKLIKFNGQNRLNFSGGYDHGCVANYETPDGGNRVLLTEVGEFDATELLASMEAYFVAKAEALAAARAEFDAAYAEAEAILAEAALSVTENEVALQTTDENASFYLWCNVPDPEEGSIHALVDGTTTNGEFFHSSWHTSVSADIHYLEVDLGEGNEIAEFTFGYHTRVFDGGNDFPDAIQVMGSNDGENFTEVYSITSGLPQGGDKSWKSAIISSETAYRYFRFNITAERTYWHMSEFDIITSDISVAEKYAAVAKEIVALNKAYTDAANNADYDVAALTAAAEAMKASIEAIKAGVVEPEPETPFDWAGTYVFTGEPTSKDGNEYPAKFEVVVEFVEANAETGQEEMYLVTSFMGNDVNAINYGGIELTIAEDGKSATLANGNVHSLGGGNFLKLFDADGAANPVAITLNEDGTLTMADFTVVMGAWGNNENNTLMAEYKNNTLVKGELPEPEPEPLNVVAVTPAEDEVVNSLREITIEFDAEIAVKELAGTERISIQYRGISTILIGTTATVEGNTLKLVADSEINDSGKHTLVIPAGVVTRVSDGVAYEGGTFTFTVEKAAVVVEPLTVVAVTPAEAVETLKTITIEFSDNVDVPATASGKFTITDADGNTVATLYAWDAAVEGKIVTLTLAEAITTAGEYTFSFAEGLVARQGDQATCAYTCTITVTGGTGIDSINGEAGESVIYDITGRKIEKITEGGIYIINGKKVLVK